MGDDGCRAIVIAGAGACFSAGADLKEPIRDAADRRHRLNLLHQVVRLIVTGPKPVIAAVDGAAYGAGFSFAAACDLVVATRQAQFGAAFGRIGLMPDAGLLWSLPQRVGFGLARELVFTGRPVDGEEAKAVGIADVLVE